MENDFYGKIVELIEDNLANEDFTVEELAEKAGLSRSMLHRKLIKRIGKSATDLITEIRIERGKELLEKSDYTSAEIAYKVGFNSPSYFNKVFKKYYQISPGDIRKGKKVISVNELRAEKNSNRWFKIPGLVVLTVLLAVVLTWAGVHFFKGKTDYTEKSIAILPFDNLSSNNNTQFFADGIVEDLLTRLSALNNLKVTSRTSSEMLVHLSFLLAKFDHIRFKGMPAMRQKIIFMQMNLNLSTHFLTDSSREFFILLISLFIRKLCNSNGLKSAN